MSISLTVKNEILDYKPTKSCCRTAFLSGVIKGVGSLLIEKNDLSLIIQHNNLKLIEKCYDIINTIFNSSPIISKKDRDRTVGSKTVYELKFKNASKYLKTLGIIDCDGFPIESISALNITDECCKKTFLKGLFIASGTITNPASSVLLEIKLQKESVQKNLYLMLKDIGIEFKLRSKQNLYILYLKSITLILDLLGYLNLNNSYFELTDLQLRNEIINNTNRVTNCEIANINKQVMAAEKYIFAVKLIEKTVGLNSLNPQLKETALLRLKNPSLSLSGLLELHNNSVTKSGLNHRLRKIQEIAELIEKNKN